VPDNSKTVIKPCPSTFYELTLHCGGVNRTFSPPNVVTKPFLSWLVVEQVAACIITIIHQFAGDKPGKRQNVSCCTKTQLQIVFYFIFCSWYYSVGTGTHLIPSTVLWCSSSHFPYNKSMVICISSQRQFIVLSNTQQCFIFSPCDNLQA